MIKIDKNTLNELDSLGIQLNKNTNIKLNRKTTNRIINSVYKKVGIKRSKVFIIQPRFIACAAAIVVIITTLFLISNDDITNNVTPIASTKKNTATPNSIIYKPYTLSDSGFFNSIANTNDGGYIAVGETLDKGDKSSYKSFLIKFDKNGKEEWSNKYTICSNDFIVMKKIIQSTDGGYFVAGFNKTIDTDCYPNITKFDKDGNKVWSKTFNDITYTIVPLLMQRKNGNLIVSIGSKIIKYDQNGNFLGEIGNRSIIMIQTKDDGFAEIIGNTIRKYDCDLNIIWSYEYKGKPHYGVSLNTITETSDGNIYVAGGLHLLPEFEYLVNNPESSSDQSGFILKFDTKGNMMWSKNYQSEKLTTFNSIKVLADDTIIAQCKYGYINQIFYICNLNKEGEIITKNVNSNINFIPFDIIQLNNKRYVACGAIYPDPQMDENGTVTAAIFVFDNKLIN